MDKQTPCKLQVQSNMHFNGISCYFEANFELLLLCYFSARLFFSAIFYAFSNYVPKEFQFEVWNLMMQKFTVIHLSSRILLICIILTMLHKLGIGQVTQDRPSLCHLTQPYINLALFKKKKVYMIDLTMLPPVGYRGSRHPTGYLAGHGSMLFQGLVVGKSGRIGIYKQHPPVSEKCQEASIVCSHHTNPGFVHPRQVFHSPPCFFLLFLCFADA